MLFWHNFDKTRYKPRLDLVVRMPAGGDAESFARGCEAVVGTMIRGDLEGVEIHQPGAATLDAVRAGLGDGATLLQEGGDWVIRDPQDGKLRVVVLRFHFLGAGIGLVPPEPHSGEVPH